MSTCCDLKVKNILEKEFSAWTKFELIFASSIFFIVLFSALYKGDSLLAIIAALGGIVYTILAGKGKAYCYFFGIAGTLCCAYLSYELALYGNFILHLAYYFPMEIMGFFAWKNHLNPDTNEIIKEKLTHNELLVMICVIAISTLFMYWFFLYINDKSPFVDAFMTVLSVAGMILTVRRSIEQWVVWTGVNILSVMLWFDAYVAGEKIFSVFLVRIIYLVLGVYFFIKWKKQQDF